MDIIDWIEEFFFRFCNSDWEHNYGIKIETIDNPGWRVEIDLIDTYLQDKNFSEISIERTEFDWIFCCVENNIFKGTGGVNNLKEILEIFRDWVEGNT